MNPTDFLETVLTPGLAWLQQTVGDIPPPSRDARVLLLAIAGQESAWTYRHQQGGPAVGFWQFEKGGGVAGVMSAAASADKAYKAARAAGIPLVNILSVYHHLETQAGDNLAVTFARLLLWTDARPLPAYGDENVSWDCYIRNWRPGKPSRSRWAEVYREALAADMVWNGGVTAPALVPTSLAERRFQAALAVYAAIDFDKVDDDAEIVRRVLAAADGVT